MASFNVSAQSYTSTSGDWATATTIPLDEEHFFPCVCGCAAVSVSVSGPEDFDDVRFQLWEPRAYHNSPFLRRLQQAWRVLRGKDYADEILLTKPMARLLAEHLQRAIADV